MKIFSGRSNQPLAAEIAAHLGTELGEVESYNFSDGEIRIAFKENIRNEDVFIIQSTNPPSDNILEFLFDSSPLHFQWRGYPEPFLQSPGVPGKLHDRCPS